MSSEEMAFLAPAIRTVYKFAVENKLDEDSMSLIARNTAQQEYALMRVARTAGAGSGISIVLDAIRTPTSRAIEATPTIRTMDLVAVYPTKPQRDLPAEQVKLLNGFGIKGKTYAAVLPDTPETWNQINSLGSAVETHELQAPLPVWGR